MKENHVQLYDKEWIKTEMKDDVDLYNAFIEIRAFQNSNTLPSLPKS